MDKTIYNPQYRRLIDRLRSARKQAGITQREASFRLGATRSWVGKIETCELRLDVHGLACLARIYGVDAGRLVHQMQEELSEEDGSSLAIRRRTRRLGVTARPGRVTMRSRPSSGAIMPPRRKIGVLFCRKLQVCFAEFDMYPDRRPIEIRTYPDGLYLDNIMSGRGLQNGRAKIARAGSGGGT